MNDFKSVEQIRIEFADSMGYGTHVVMMDGGVLCPQCVDDESELLEEEYHHCIEEGMVATESSQWMMVKVDANYEDSNLSCSHCDSKIDPIYSNN